jgi:hypothetical protein
MSVINSTYYINKGILCPKKYDVHHISEVLTSLDEQVKTCFIFTAKIGFSFVGEAALKLADLPHHS